MRRVHFFHWNADEAVERVARIRAAGYEVAFDLPTPATLKELRNNPPDAVVIDLDRLPAQGRDLGVALRTYKNTYRIPIVFVAGKPEKVRRVQEALPDAVFTPWSRIRSSLKRAISMSPAEPLRHQSVFAGYSGTPLPKKLGIKAHSTIALVGAPRDFETTLGPLPDAVTLRRQARGRPDMVVWFTKSKKDLDSRLEKMGSLAGRDGLWIVWPKKKSGVGTDLSQTVVRKAGLDSGLVDYKVCSVDETWTGLKFTQRKPR